MLELSFFCSSLNTQTTEYFVYLPQTPSANANESPQDVENFY